MNLTRGTILVSLLAAILGSLFITPSASATDASRSLSRHFDLVNATFDDIIALAMAPTNSDAFQDIALDQPLPGGLNSVTFDVPPGGCLRDLRVTFHNGRIQRFPRIDVCRSSGLRLGPRVTGGG